MVTDLQKLLLENRGITDTEDQEAFLYPSYSNLHDPFLMNDLESACDRIYHAIKNDESVCIYGDYDCDGIPGSIVLLELFKKVGHSRIDVYIPDRHGEGYGLNTPALAGIREKGTQLLITIDLGISNKNEVAHAIDIGMDVIVTDHHEPPKDIPEGVLLVHPKIGSYPEPDLCGAGVAYKIVQGFLKKYGEEFSVIPGWEKWLLDLVGFATLSDMVPLRGENRILSYFGMTVLRKTRRLGFLEMLADLGINTRTVTEDDIYFSMAPRINAASRMESPRRAFELLEADDPISARKSSAYLALINDERKKLVTRIMKDVHTTLESRTEQSVIVIGNPVWRIGVLGLIASRIVESYGKPAFVWGREGSDTIKGSCRSDGTVHLVELMNHAKSVFIEYGGHEGAGGFAVSNESVHLLEEHLTASLSLVTRTESKKNNIVDGELSVSDVSYNLFEEIQTLAPFGVANPKPQFLFKNVYVESAKQFGKEKNHFEIIISDEKRKIKAIKFFSKAGDFEYLPEEGGYIDLVGSVELSLFRGARELRLRIERILRSGSSEV